MAKVKTNAEDLFAVVKIGGLQFKVVKNDQFLVDHLKDTKLSLKPLLVATKDKVEIGKPEVTDWVCELEVIDQEVKGDKKMVFRYKPKTGYHRKKGPRALYSRIKIVDIKKVKNNS
ncbi:MAG: 50S ribosomal protein L21 [Patescibacteria group bacterium]|nr:50S ribosomal protein L21 [Patescibacteria group bacterium]